MHNSLRLLFPFGKWRIEDAIADFDAVVGVARSGLWLVVNGAALGCGRQDLDELGRVGGSGLLLHCDVGGGWGSVHGIAAGDDGDVGVVPGVVAGDADEDDEAGHDSEDGEGGSLGAVEAAGEPGASDRLRLDYGGEVGDTADRKAEEDSHAGVPGEVQAPGQP